MKDNSFLYDLAAHARDVDLSSLDIEHGCCFIENISWFPVDSLTRMSNLAFKSGQIDPKWANLRDFGVRSNPIWMPNLTSLDWRRSFPARSKRTFCRCDFLSELCSHRHFNCPHVVFYGYEWEFAYYTHQGIRNPLQCWSESLNFREGIDFFNGCHVVNNDRRIMYHPSFDRKLNKL